MIKKIIYYLFDSENKYLNSLAKRQLKMLDEQQHVKDYFRLLNQNKNE